jgi:hypothetical protein
MRWPFCNGNFQKWTQRAAESQTHPSEHRYHNPVRFSVSVICEGIFFFPSLFPFWEGDRFLFSGVSDVGSLNLAVGKRVVLPEGEWCVFREEMKGALNGVWLVSQLLYNMAILVTLLARRDILLCFPIQNTSSQQCASLCGTVTYITLHGN